MVKFLFPLFWLNHSRRFEWHQALSYMSLGAWVAVGATALSAASGIYGANKQAQANAEANAANIAAQKEAERQNWMRYLMSRGINAGPDTQTGQVPGLAPGAAINTKMPLWANVVTEEADPSAPFLIPKGQSPTPSTRWRLAPNTVPAAQAFLAPPASSNNPLDTAG